MKDIFQLGVLRFLVGFLSEDLAFFMQVGIPVLGVVENMSGLSQEAQLFKYQIRESNGAMRDATSEVQHLLMQHFGNVSLLNKLSLWLPISMCSS